MAWRDISVGEFLVWLGIRFFQESVRLSSIDDYWNTPKDGAFPPFNKEKFMSRGRFYQIANVLQLSSSDCEEQQVIDLISLLNNCFQKALSPGNELTVDESMIAIRHQDLQGIKKIARKPRPIGCEIKNLCDSRKSINLVLEKNEVKEKMESKKFHSTYGSTTACNLRLAEPYFGSGRTLYGDSWFGSVKSATALLEHGTCSTFIVKTAQKFPKRNVEARGFA